MPEFRRDAAAQKHACRATETPSPPVQHRTRNWDNGLFERASSGHAGLVLADRHRRHRHRSRNAHRQRRHRRPRRTPFHPELPRLVAPLISAPAAVPRSGVAAAQPVITDEDPSMCQRPAPRSGVVGTINKCSNEVSEPIRSVTDREQGLERGHFTSAGCSAHRLLTLCEPVDRLVRKRASRPGSGCPTRARRNALRRTLCRMGKTIMREEARARISFFELGELAQWCIAQ